jgi:hypothetical protein
MHAGDEANYCSIGGRTWECVNSELWKLRIVVSQMVAVY